jgi:tetratricopeptide (TPR) repeat protein
VLYFLQGIQGFYTKHKQFIDNLLNGGLIAITILLINIIYFWIRNRRKANIDDPSKHHYSTFPFHIIKPHSNGEVLRRAFSSGKDDDPLAARNIPYQKRKIGRDITQELEQKIRDKNWVLILGRTGVGKTREAAELAKLLNREGWTVLFLKSGGYLDIPTHRPKEIHVDRKLLLFLDNLNQRMESEEKNPKAREDLLEPIAKPFQVRLLGLLEAYEKFYEQVRVIATARNERYPDSSGKCSSYNKLKLEKYPKLWNRFYTYDLPQPDIEPIIDLLFKVIPKTNISPNPQVYSELAKRNDGTFNNIVENLIRIQNRKLPLNITNFEETLSGSWEKRYQDVLNNKKYPASRCIYDAIDLLSQFDIEFQPFTVEAVARVLANVKYWQFWRRYKIHITIKYLIESQNILEPRDGQIEAKGYQLEVRTYVSKLSKLLVILTKKHPDKMLFSLLNFSVKASNLECYEDAIISLDQAIKIKPEYYKVWYNKGVALRYLERFEDAIVCFEQAVKIQPDFYEAWYNKGLALRYLERFEDAIVCFEQAIKIKPDFSQAYLLKGLALFYLERFEDAITFEDVIVLYEQAIKIKPDFHEAWYNKACCYAIQKNIDKAIENLQQAIKLNPEKYRELAKNDYDFDNIRDNERFQALLQSYEE